MKFSSFAFLAVIACLLTIQASAQEKTSSSKYPFQPVLFTSVKLNDSFWAPRIKINHDVTIPFTFGKCESTGRIKNFEMAAGLKEGDFCTQFTFDDTDVYKIIEGASYSLQIFKDPKLELKVDSLISLIGQAQEPDGYLYTNRTIMGNRAHEWAGTKRWEKEHILSHELYNVGHLIEAAIAHYHATGKKSLLNIAIKAADLVCKDFGPDKLHQFSGHQIIELAMAKLYEVTGERKYLDVGKFILDARGPDGDSYNQSHKRVVDQHEAVGHAVRAAYMYAGMADIAALTGDSLYVKAIDDIWEDAVYKKIYVTGGIGATGEGEAFGAAYHLPNLSAYNETCASIANVYWNYRQFLLHGESKYYDVLERTLYNAFLSGVALTGDRFFYPNPLESHGQHERSPWFSCACCPSNVTRFIPSVGGYFYAQKDNAIYVNLFGEGTAAFKVGSTSLTLEQKTKYPWEGKIELTVIPSAKLDFDLNVRIPGWALNDPIPGELYSFKDNSDDKPTLLVNGKKVDYKMNKGYAILSRKWSKGDKVSIELPMKVRKVSAHANVAEDKDKLAYQRGPLMYCAEWVDNRDKKALNLMIAEDAKLEAQFDPTFFNGMYVLKTPGQSLAYTANGLQSTRTEIKLIPYFSWAHRGPGQMMVWIPTKLSSAKPSPIPTVASQSKVSASYKTKALMAVNDLQEPANSNDHSITFFHWWPMKDTVQWIQYDFEVEQNVSSSKVYWFDDGPEGGCRIPAGWKLLYKKGEEWIPVVTTKDYEITKDKYSEVSFQPVTTSALRLEVTLPKEHSAGVMEWSVH